MTVSEVHQLEEIFEKYDHPERRSYIFHNKETGEAVVIVFKPDVVGMTKLKDILTLRDQAFDDIILYCKTRSFDELVKIVGTIRRFKVKEYDIN